MKASQGRDKGQYWPTTNEGVRSAVFYCPSCGEGMGLQNHIISIEGEVSPSVVEPVNSFPKCPNGRCGTFHEFITLENWNQSP